MRIIGGIWRGRTIFPPKGTGTRPTTDRVRESLMSTLMSVRDGFDDACVLDAFAGSGALGIEVLSRGAVRATFCEKDRGALAALRRNLDIVGVDTTTTPSAIIRRGDSLTYPPIDTRHPYDLVFLDPPYAMSVEVVFTFLSRLNESGSLQGASIVSYEHSTNRSLPDSFIHSGVTWKRIKEKRYGETVIDLLRKEP